MIDLNFLHDIVTYVDARVKKVVLNESYEISQFTEKNINDNTVVLNYIIPVEEVSHVSLIELKDADDRLITSNPVDIPITVDQLMLQTIRVKGVV